MVTQQQESNQWTEAERAGIRSLLRMAAILFLAIVVAGAIAAIISLVFGTL